jgi:GDPmannose 4,6-dehydratase
LALKTALITGIGGQDGSYLAELLLAKGYTVHGVVRRCSACLVPRLAVANASKRVQLHYGEMTEGESLRRIIRQVQPDEVYNLAAQSDVGVSFKLSEYTSDVIAMGTLRLLEALREYRDDTHRDVRFYQASSSEMYGSVLETPQRESTSFRPRSPYGIAKLFAHWATINFRESYGLYASCGIMFNHESPRRGESFVTRKITRAVGRIKHGLQSELFLGNLDARRDWGFAGDYVDAMWRMLQQQTGDSFVIATGVVHAVREVVEYAFSSANLCWSDFVRSDPALLRPAEVDVLVGDPSKARRELDWQSTMTFHELIDSMVEHDLDLAERESFYKKNSTSR